MRKNIQYITLFLLLVTSLFGQSKNDSLFEVIKPYLYENPNKGIAIANELIKKENNIDSKIKYHLYLSKAYTAKRDFDNSLKVLIKCQELIKKSTNIDSKIDVLILIAIQYQQMELYNKSIETLEIVDQECKSLDDSFESKKNNWFGKSYAIKGIIYKAQENYEIALEKFYNSIQFFEKVEKNIATTTNNISIVYYNIAYCNLYLKKLNESELNFIKSNDYAIKSKAPSLEAYAMKGLAEKYFEAKDYQKAITTLEKAKLKSEKVGDLVLNEGIYKGLADNYLSLGNFEKYQHNYDIYKKIQFEKEQSELKSINSLIDNLDKITYKEVNETENNYFTIQVIILFFAFLITLFLIINILKNNKTNKINKEKINNMFSE